MEMIQWALFQITQKLINKFLILMDDIKSQIDNLFNKTLEYRRHIHSNPELSFYEFETAKYIRSKLDELQIKWKECSGTGTIALIGNGERCVALRADIDALPIFEETDLSFKSKNDNVMHACGHDMHTAMLLTAAEILKQNEDSIKGKVKLIFQLGEEQLPGGASLMIKDGCLENPKVEAIFGQHIYPGEEVGTISLKEGPVMGSADEIYITINGKSTHAAQPHLGADPILAAAQLIVYYQTLMTKFKDPTKAGVLTLASINGGFATNVIPDKVEIKGTLRAFDNEWRKEIHNIMEEKTQLIAQSYNCEVDLEIRKGYPAVINDKTLHNHSLNTVNSIFEGKNILEFEPKMWGEDFAYYGREIPAYFWFLGVRPKNLTSMPALHNSKLNPDENAMKYGIQMLVLSAINYLNN